MKASLKALLDKAIEEWSCKAADHEDWPPVYHHEQLVDRMTQAAEIVFDSSVEASKYTEQEITSLSR